MYAAGRPHRYKAACARLLQEATAGGDEYAVDTELLQDVLHVYAMRGERARGLQTCEDLLRVFPSPIAIRREEVLVASRMMGRHQFLSARDAIHAAVAQVWETEGIVSADRVFDRLPELKRFDPLAL